MLKAGFSNNIFDLFSISILNNLLVVQNLSMALKKANI